MFTWLSDATVCTNELAVAPVARTKSQVELTPLAQKSCLRKRKPSRCGRGSRSDDALPVRIESNRGGWRPSGSPCARQATSRPEKGCHACYGGWGEAERQVQKAHHISNVTFEMIVRRPSNRLVPAACDTSTRTKQAAGQKGAKVSRNGGGGGGRGGPHHFARRGRPKPRRILDSSTSRCWDGHSPATTENRARQCTGPR